MNSEKRWPVGIIIVVTIFVIVLIGFLIFSQQQRVNLVSEDYYEQQIKYQKQIERILRTQALLEKPQIRYDKQKNLVTLHFPHKGKHIDGTIQFFRPADSTMDREIPVKTDKEAKQVISTKNLSGGLWKLKIFWQVDEVEYYFDLDLDLE